jgi:hypothetical protein
VISLKETIVLLKEMLLTATAARISPVIIYAAGLKVTKLNKNMFDALDS